MSVNTLLNIENASSVRKPSDIDQYTQTRFYDVNNGSQFPPNFIPDFLTFRNQNLQDFFDFGNGNLVLRFRMDKAAINNLQTIRSDCRTWFDRVELRLNGTLIQDSSYFYKYADYSRSQFSPEYYKTIGSTFYCYDNFMWDNPNLTLDGPTGVVPMFPVAVISDNASLAVKSSYVNCNLSGAGKRYQLTSQKLPDEDTNIIQGKVLTATIPFRHLCPWFQQLRCVLKNVSIELKVYFRENQLLLESYGGDPTDAKVYLNEAYIEIPKVVPSAPNLIRMDAFLQKSPKIQISFPNFKVVRNFLQPSIANQLIMIDNIPQRLIRASSFVVPKARDSGSDFSLNPRDIVCVSARNKIREFQYFVNSVPVPNTRMIVQQNDNAMTSNVGAGQTEDTHDIYRAYMELCEAMYENNPFSTENGLVSKFRNNGVYDYWSFSELFPYFTTPLDRSRNSEEYISGSAQLSAQVLTDGNADLGDYWLWTVIEYISDTELQMEPTNCFVTMRN